MEYQTNKYRGEIIDCILANRISTTPVQSTTDFMYIVGNGDVFITIQCDKYGNEKSAFCIKNIKHHATGATLETNYIKFENHEDAKFVNAACKQRIIGQSKEQAKIERFNQRFK